MKYLKVVVSAFLVGLTGALMPGPMLVAVVTLAPRTYLNVLYILAGHALAEVPIVVALWLGLAGLVRRGGRRAFLVMRLAGGAALVVLGVLMLRDAGRVSLSGGGGSPAEPTLHPLLVGVVVSVSNPYFLFWWATVGLGLASQAVRVGRAGLPLFYFGHIQADAYWYLVVGAAAYLGRALMTGAVYRWIVTGGGIFLAGFGLYFAAFVRRHEPAGAAPARVVIDETGGGGAS